METTVDPNNFQVKEFSVLGHSIRWKAEKEGESFGDIERAIRLMESKAREILQVRPDLGREQLYLLVALELSLSRVMLEKRCFEDIEELDLLASEAVSLFNKVYPSKEQTTH